MQPMFEVYEFSCGRCDGLVEIRKLRIADSGRDIWQMMCANCGQVLEMSAMYLHPRPTDSASADMTDKS
jgi:transcription elongation factor Elf1